MTLTDYIIREVWLSESHLLDRHCNLSYAELRLRLIKNAKLQNASTFVGDADDIIDMIKDDMLKNIKEIEAKSNGQRIFCIYCPLVGNVKGMLVRQMEMDKKYKAKTYTIVFKLLETGCYKVASVYPM